MYYFIINPKSRSGLGTHIWHAVQRKLDELQISYTYYYTHYEYHAKKIADRICRNNKGIKKIVVIGGDGTMNEVINGVTSYNEILLGYIPSGSSNDLARGLNIPSDPLQALNLILNGNHFRYYDHGLLTLPKQSKSRKFAVSAGIGLDADICKEALDSKIKLVLNKLLLGKLTYGVIGLKQLVSFQPFDAEFQFDHGVSFRLPNVLFAASMIHPCEGGGLKLVPHANPRDRKLSVCIFYDIPKWKAVLILPSLFFGWHRFLSHGVKLFDCTSLTIKTTTPVSLHTDGELAGKTDLVQLGCTKKQIRMML